MTLSSNGRGWLWPLTGLGFVVAAGSGILFVFHVAAVVVLALGVVTASASPGPLLTARADDHDRSS